MQVALGVVSESRIQDVRQLEPAYVLTIGITGNRPMDPCSREPVRVVRDSSDGKSRLCVLRSSVLSSASSPLAPFHSSVSAVQSNYRGMTSRGQDLTKNDGDVWFVVAVGRLSWSANSCLESLTLKTNGT